MLCRLPLPPRPAVPTGEKRPPLAPAAAREGVAAAFTLALRLLALPLARTKASVVRPLPPVRGETDSDDDALLLDAAGDFNRPANAFAALTTLAALTSDFAAEAAVAAVRREPGVLGAAGVALVADTEEEAAAGEYCSSFAVIPVRLLPAGEASDGLFTGEGETEAARDLALAAKLRG